MSLIKDALAGGGTEIQQKSIEVTVLQPDTPFYEDPLVWIAIISGIAVPVLLRWLSVRKRRK